MHEDDFEQALVLDDRAGFYMVPSAAVTKARRRLSGAHLTEALAALICLARESYAQHGASRDEQQTCEVNLDALSARVLGVSRARALRVLDNLVDAGALTKHAHRFDTARGRLPTEIAFVDLAVTFAYISGAAFRALALQEPNAKPAFGPLALYLTLVGLGGEQRDKFPNANRRTATASQPELARLSGLSVSSVKRALDTLKHAGLLITRPQPDNTLKTTAIYRLIDPVESAATAPIAADISEGQAIETSNDGGFCGPLTVIPTTAHTPTDDSPQPDRPSAHSATDVGSQDDRSTARSDTDGQLTEPSCARVQHRQITDQQIQTSHLTMPCSQEGGEELDRLLSVFCDWRRQVLGDRRFEALYDEARWMQAGRTLLKQYDLERLLAGIDRVRRDSLLADKATTLPAFAQIADRAISRAAADRAYSAHRQHTPDAPSWTEASAAITKAISKHGEGGKTVARQQLEQLHHAYGPFIDTVGWTALCRESLERHQYDWKRAWEQACITSTQEAAA